MLFQFAASRCANTALLFIYLASADEPDSWFSRKSLKLARYFLRLRAARLFVRTAGESSISAVGYGKTRDAMSFLVSFKVAAPRGPRQVPSLRLLGVR